MILESKYDIGQKVWYRGYPHFFNLSEPVEMVIDEIHFSADGIVYQMKPNRSKIVYLFMPESDVYSTKEDLLKSL